MKVVLDTNILVSALRSVRGCSNEVLLRLAAGEFEMALTTSLLTEYEDVLHRPNLVPTSAADVDAFLDFICAACEETIVYYKFRPLLNDPKDEMVFECAFAAGANHIVTHNLKDFAGIENFGISPITPSKFIAILES